MDRFWGVCFLDKYTIFNRLPNIKDPITDHFSFFIFPPPAPKQIFLAIFHFPAAHYAYKKAPQHHLCLHLSAAPFLSPSFYRGKAISSTTMVNSYGPITSKRVMASPPVPIVSQPIIPPMNRQDRIITLYGCLPSPLSNLPHPFFLFYAQELEFSSSPNGAHILELLDYSS